MAWWRDLKFSLRGVQTHDSGVRLSWVFILFRALPAWLPYLIAETYRSLGRRKSFTITCLPEQPRPWHAIRHIVKRAGGCIVDTTEHSNALMFFDERTRSKPPQRPDPLTPDFNFRCVDTSKSRVARDFQIIFGYPLAVTPEQHEGLMVMKSDINGRQDGRVIQGPVLPEPGFAYQKLIDNRIDRKHVQVLSCPTVRGEIPFVYVARRKVAHLFSNQDTSVTLGEAPVLFSEDELLKIRYFCAAIGLDWGLIDVLRDKTDGRIYIVDVDKTDIGPPLALPLREKLRAAEILAEQLSRAICTVDNLSARAEPPMELAS